jgi:hypothetical protein
LSSHYLTIEGVQEGLQGCILQTGCNKLLDTEKQPRANQ